MKECFGNYMEKLCEGHYDCKEEGCYSKTMIDKGICNCPYKGSCHLGRQELEMECRKVNETNESCDFYKLLKPMYEKINNATDSDYIMT